MGTASTAIARSGRAAGRLSLAGTGTGAWDWRRERAEVAVRSAAVPPYGEHRRRKIGARSSQAHAPGGGGWELNLPGGA